ncbi:hypothetical protein Pan189_19820 [Stratiformator vulcanicus]|uniref:Uncharacterized protein n=2 Tax=Stratiformator vulcanicus TaxID=2527980 RepID=A0A517R134_9PLAN|nr:hypothetical protein Pan189_19820 [Stratiformator vulcanicus]
MGIAAVAFTYIRRALSDESWLTSSDLWRQVVLLFSIALFFVYIDITYEIEFYKGENSAVKKIEISEDIFEKSTFLPRIRLLLLLPIDLIGMGLMASLFGVLLVFGTNKNYWSGPSTSTSLEVMYLLALTASWHFVMIGWWLVYGLTALDVTLALWDVILHASFSVVEIITILIIRRIRNSDWGLRNSNLVAWSATLLYSSVLITLYAVRLWDYSTRFIRLVISN